LCTIEACDSDECWVENRDGGALRHSPKKKIDVEAKGWADRESSLL